MSKLNFQKLFDKAKVVPFRILVKGLKILADISTRSYTALLQVQKELIKNSTFQLVPLDQLSGFAKIAETHGGIENIILPKIFGLSEGGSISVKMQGDYLCKLTNITYVPYSDFIRDLNGHVSNEKLFRKEYDVLIPRDRDIIKIKGNILRLARKKDIIHSKIAFHLMGTYSYQWAHFLSQYYPKLRFLNFLPKEEIIDLIIPNNTDPHIAYLIKNELNNYKNINLLEVDKETEIACEKLYHVSLGTFLGDDGYFPTPFSIIISKSTVNFWNQKAMELVPSNLRQFRKIFIGRTGNRSLKNYNEVLEYFIQNGFEEIFPHLLNIEAKIKLFNEAKYIVGPWSSGFTNSIYSQQGTKLLAFVNSFRYLDPYLSGFNNLRKNEFWFLTGKDDTINDMNSSYEISLHEIRQFLKEKDFLDNYIKV